jgi:hypothetical protein
LPFDGVIWTATDEQGLLADAERAGKIPGRIMRFEFNTGFVIAVVKEPSMPMPARFALDMSSTPFRVVRLSAPPQVAA